MHGRSFADFFHPVQYWSAPGSGQSRGGTGERRTGTTEACPAEKLINRYPVRWNQPIRSLLAAGEGLLDRLLCVVGAVLFSQVPEFIQQYLQRLGGHLDEARRQLEQFQTVAAQSGLTLDQLVARNQGGGEPITARLGQVIQETVARVDALAAADAAIRQASMLSRPFVFLRHLDFSIVHATWTIFKPAVPSTMEGLVYAGSGVLLALAFYHGGVKPVVRRAWCRAERRVGAARPAAAAPCPKMPGHDTSGPGPAG